MKLVRHLNLMVMALILISCAPRVVQRLPANEIGRYIHQLVMEENQAVADWGIYARDLETGKTLIDFNGDKLFLPASNTKLYTTAAALKLLGPDFRYTTVVIATGTVQDSILAGDLIVVGGGDPTWSARFYEDDPTYVFRGWADSLRTMGIGTITGDIIGVEAFFDDSPLGSGWVWDNEPYYTSAQIAGLSFNENCLDFTIEPGRVGEAPNIIPSPATSYVVIENNLVTLDTLALLDSLGILDSLGLADSLAYLDTLIIPDTIKVPVFKWGFDRPRGTNRIILDGIYSAGDTIETGASVEDPVAYTATVLRETLIGTGIDIRGGIQSRTLYEDGQDYELPEGDTLFIFQSPPLEDIIYYLNKDSQNYMAETLLRTIGTLAGDGGSARKGRRLARPAWAEMGVDTNTTLLTDGSGLSRYNKVTPRNTVNLLAHMRPDTSFVRSLPIAGVDGTLENRMAGTAAEGRVFAKTGSLSHVLTLSGYAINRKGHWIAFSIMVNDYMTPSREIRERFAQLCEFFVLQ